jgi:hypothetical protein
LVKERLVMVLFPEIVMAIKADETDHNERRKPYSRPTLTIYGTVQELTKSVGIHGMPDSSPVPPFNIKTTF